MSSDFDPQEGFGLIAWGCALVIVAAMIALAIYLRTRGAA